MSRTLRTLAVLALVVLMIAGCANSPAETDDSSNNDNASAPVTTDTRNGTAEPTANGAGSNNGDDTADPSAQGLKFAACMRSNGVQDFPDPDASGSLTIDAIANGSSLDTDSAAFKRALDACKDLQPAGFTGTKATSEQQVARLKFAQCIRDNGVSDFPDPAPDAPLIDTNRIPSANRPGGMNTLHAAMQKCREAARQAGVTGP